MLYILIIIEIIHILFVEKTTYYTLSFLNIRYIIDNQQYSTSKSHGRQVDKYLRMCKLMIFSTILGLYLHFGK